MPSVFNTVTVTNNSTQSAEVKHTVQILQGTAKVVQTPLSATSLKKKLWHQDIIRDTTCQYILHKCFEVAAKNLSNNYCILHRQGLGKVGRFICGIKARERTGSDPLFLVTGSA